MRHRKSLAVELTEVVIIQKLFSFKFVNLFGIAIGILGDCMWQCCLTVEM